MAEPSMDLTAFIGKLLEEQDGDILREGIRVLAQALMEAGQATDQSGVQFTEADVSAAANEAMHARGGDARLGALAGDSHRHPPVAHARPGRHS